MKPVALLFISLLAATAAANAQPTVEETESKWLQIHADDLAKEYPTIGRIAIYANHYGANRSRRMDQFESTQGVYRVRTQRGIEFLLQVPAEGVTQDWLRDALVKGVMEVNERVSRAFNRYMMQMPHGVTVGMHDEATEGLMLNGVLILDGVLYARSTSGGTEQFMLAGEHGEVQRIEFDRAGNDVDVKIFDKDGKTHKCFLSGGTIFNIRDAERR